MTTIEIEKLIEEKNFNAIDQIYKDHKDPQGEVKLEDSDGDFAVIKKLSDTKYHYVRTSVKWAYNEKEAGVYSKTIEELENGEILVEEVLP